MTQSKSFFLHREPEESPSSTQMIMVNFIPVICLTFSYDESIPIILPKIWLYKLVDVALTRVRPRR
jgi:hypothetical protein